MAQKYSIKKLKDTIKDEIQMCEESIEAFGESQNPQTVILREKAIARKDALVGVLYVIEQNYYAHLKSR